MATESLDFLFHAINASAANPIQQKNKVGDNRLNGVGWNPGGTGMDSKDLIIAALHRRCGGGTVTLRWEELSQVRFHKIHVTLTSEGEELTAEVTDDSCLCRFRENEGLDHD